MPKWNLDYKKHLNKLTKGKITVFLYFIILLNLAFVAGYILFIVDDQSTETEVVKEDKEQAVESEEEDSSIVPTFLCQRIEEVSTGINKMTFVLYEVPYDYENNLTFIYGNDIEKIVKPNKYIEGGYVKWGFEIDSSVQKITVDVGIVDPAWFSHCEGWETYLNFKPWQRGIERVSN